jgi:hypothetical protein
MAATRVYISFDFDYDEELKNALVGQAKLPGRVTVADAGGSVAVRTYDPAGNPADLPFHLLVAC